MGIGLTKQFSSFLIASSIAHNIEILNDKHIRKITCGRDFNFCFSGFFSIIFSIIRLINLIENNDIYGWGDNIYSQLGIKYSIYNKSSENSPLLINSFYSPFSSYSNLVFISCGFYHAIGLTGK